MKILHVIPALTYEQGGTCAVAHALARYQAAANHDVTVLTTDSGVRHGEHPLPLPGAVRRVEAAVRGPDRVAYAPGFPALAREHLRACDVAHVHSVFNYPTHAALSVAAALRTPVVLSPHGMLQPLMIRRSRLAALKKFIYLTTWGNRLRRSCTAWHYTSTNERDASWPNEERHQFVLELGVDLDASYADRIAARAAVAARWPQLADAPYVLFLGRLHPKKQPGFLVEAFLAGAPSKYKLVLAGPDEFGQWGEIRGRHLANPVAAERVVATGPVVGDDRKNLYSAATVFALPSINENFGLTVLEALGAGTPVLSSPHVDLSLEAAAASLADIVPLDLALWRDWFARLPANTEPPVEFIAAAREWVRTRYAWPSIAARFAERYTWVTAGCPNEARG